MTQRVLLAIDGSEAAERAVELCTSIAWPEDTRLRVATVVEPLNPIIAADWSMAVNEADDPGEIEAKRTANAIVEQAVRRLARSGLAADRCVLRGRPASRIVEAAEDFSADLIVVGSRGHGTIASMILGSVSAEVADHAHCPVLVARSTGLTRVILGVDGSGFARTAESVLESWPIFEKAAIEATAVAQVALPWTAGLVLTAYEPPGAAMGDIKEPIVAEMRGFADAAALRLKEAGRTASARVVTGAPAAELIQAARDHHADLIVVGTHGSTGLTRAIAGSVARNVMLHAKCSVLFVREIKDEARAAAA
jgi:nucleotide-binding universal stress UspA family protein